MKFSLIGIFTFILVFSFSVFAQSVREQGVEAYRKGDYQSAIGSLKAVTKSNKTDAEAWNILGMSYIRISSYKESRKAFENAIKQNPQKVEFYINLAYANLLSNRLSQAEKDIKKTSVRDKKDGKLLISSKIDLIRKICLKGVFHHGYCIAFL